MTADEIRAAVLALPPRPKRRGRPRGSDITLSLALKIERRTLELGGERGHQTQAILEALNVRPRSATKTKALDRGKKVLKRHPLAKFAARTEHQIKAGADSLERLKGLFGDIEAEARRAAEFGRVMREGMEEIDRRLRNVPQDRRGALMHMPMRTLIDLLRDHSIDGNFPLEVLDDIER